MSGARRMLSAYADGIAFDFTDQSYAIKTAGVVVAGAPGDVLSGSLNYSGGGLLIASGTTHSMTLASVPLGATATSTYWEGDLIATFATSATVWEVGTLFSGNGVFGVYKPSSVAQYSHNGSTQCVSLNGGSGDGAAKISCRYKLNDFAISRDGTAVTADTSGAYSQPTAGMSLKFTGSSFSGSTSDIRVKKFVMIPEGVSDVTLVSWSTSGVA